MQGLLLLLSGVGWVLDLVVLVLDLNYWLVSTLVSFLYWTLRFIFGLPGAVTLTLLQCWEYTWLGLVAVGESCLGLGLGAVQALGNLLRGALAGLDGLQLAWNLLCHVLIRSKEMMQRSFLSVALSGQNLHRQVWEAVTISASLATYLVNTVLNLLLIAIQYVLSAVLSLWLGIVNVLFVSKEWIIAMCSQLSNSAMATVLVLGAPFQMAVDGLLLCSSRVGAILSKHFYEVLLLLLLIWVTRVVFRPSPALHFLQEKLNMFYQTLLVCLHIILSSDVWRRVVERSIHLLRMYGAAWYRGVNHMRTRAQEAVPRDNRVQNPPEPAPLPVFPPPRLPFHVQPRQNLTANRRPATRQAPPAPPCRSSSSRAGDAAAEDPWKLLKQQEESRKCVICQDEAKSILLLPCRHLCLCAQCTHILLQQPILQRNCPLCRQMILQTLNVYM